MEHRHQCLYCRVLWFCHEDCPFAGPSACADCREKVRRSPDMPRRVIMLEDGSRVLDSLAQREAERIRALIRRDRRL